MSKPSTHTLFSAPSVSVHCTSREPLCSTRDTASFRLLMPYFAGTYLDFHTHLLALLTSQLRQVFCVGERRQWFLYHRAPHAFNRRQSLTSRGWTKKGLPILFCFYSKVQRKVCGICQYWIQSTIKIGINFSTPQWHSPSLTWATTVKCLHILHPRMGCGPRSLQIHNITMAILGWISHVWIAHYNHGNTWMNQPCMNCTL